MVPDAVSIVSNSAADELINIAPRPQSQMSAMSSRLSPSPMPPSSPRRTQANDVVDTDKQIPAVESNDMNNNNDDSPQSNSPKVGRVSVQTHHLVILIFTLLYIIHVLMSCLCEYLCPGLTQNYILIDLYESSF